MNYEELLQSLTEQIQISSVYAAEYDRQQQEDMNFDNTELLNRIGLGVQRR